MKYLKKNVVILVMVSILSIFLGVFIAVLLYNPDNQTEILENKNDQQELSVILKEERNFEINSEVQLLSLVDENNKVEIISEDEIIDTSVLGEKELFIKYLDNGEKEYKFKINIVDTTSPVIEYQKEVSTTLGTQIDLMENVTVIDNSKEDIVATIEGEYDFNVVGEYHLKYIAIDSSGNKAEEEFILKVNDESAPDTSIHVNQTVSSSDTSNNSSTSNPNTTSPTNDNDNQNNENISTPTPVIVQEHRQAEAKKILALVNQVRKENGLNELKWNNGLESSSMVRSKELVTLYSHTRPNQTEFYTAINIDYVGAGENIAFGQTSAEEVFTGWMNSPPHRANILNSNYTDIGMSLYFDSEVESKYHWVQLFATILEEKQEYRQAEAKKILTLINQERKKNGLSELQWSTSLESFAMIRAKEIVTNFSHTRPNQTEFYTVITSPYTSTGELLAGGQTTPEATFNIWLKNNQGSILNKKFNQAGISLYYDTSSSSIYHWAILFTD